jgi:hypothetical protein
MKKKQKTKEILKQKFWENNMNWKKDLEKLISIKKQKIIGMEMKISLKRHELAIKGVRIRELEELLYSLKENREILKSERIVVSLKEFKNSTSQLREVKKELDKFKREGNILRKKLEISLKWRDVELQELGCLEESLNGQSVLDFRKRA